jgi:hypothetical protein
VERDLTGGGQGCGGVVVTPDAGAATKDNDIDIVPP